MSEKNVVSNSSGPLHRAGVGFVGVGVVCDVGAEDVFDNFDLFSILRLSHVSSPP